jgi:hypothetical protein
MHGDVAGTVINWDQLDAAALEAISFAYLAARERSTVPRGSNQITIYKAFTVY